MLNQSHIRGLLQSLDFSEGTGTALTDKSGNGNNATVIGGTWTTDRFGRANRAILLDGVDDYIDLGLANYQGDLGVLISAKILTWATIEYIFQKGEAVGGSVPAFRIYTSATTNTLIFRVTNSAIQNQTLSIANMDILNKWDIIGSSIKDSTGVAMSGSGRQIMAVNLNVDSDFATGKLMNIGGTTFANLAVDRIMLFNRFLSGHELSKLANRLKIGDMNK